MPNLQHEIYEASAGTGKTYKVEQKVVALLQEGIPLEQILVVTFTEKAAAELLERLRIAILDARDKTLAPLLLDHALETYDNAQVFTIHAFCLRVLQQYPFDHAHGSRSRLVQDEEIIKTCLRDIQRRDWPQKYREMFGTVLALADFGTGKNFETKVLKLAGSYRPACGHKLLPNEAIDLELLRALSGTFARTHAQIKNLVGPLSGVATAHPLYQAFGTLDYKFKQYRDLHRNSYLIPVLLWATEDIPAYEQIGAFQRLSEHFDDKKHPFDMLNKYVKEKGDVARKLDKIVELLFEMSASIPKMQFALAVETAQALIQRMDAHKKTRGMQSFDDFLSRMAEALDEEQNLRAPMLLAALRTRYRVAIVDEFQDTDPLQWKIFSSIFVYGGESHRLILVGDPKQAIYSFRNADLKMYIRARDELKSRGGIPTPLNTSYRSSEPLLAGLNALFSDKAFFSGADGIAYQPVHAAPEGQRPEIVVDNTGRKAITVVRFPADAKTDALQPTAQGMEIDGVLQRVAPRVHVARQVGGSIRGKRVAFPVQ